MTHPILACCAYYLVPMVGWFTAGYLWGRLSGIRSGYKEAARIVKEVVDKHMVKGP